MARTRKPGKPKRNKRNWLQRIKVIQQNNEVLKKMSQEQ